MTLTEDLQEKLLQDFKENENKVSSGRSVYPGDIYIHEEKI
jgi:hypothetical protein